MTSTNIIAILQTLVFLAAAVIAGRTIRSNALIAAKRASLDAVQNLLLDEKFNHATRTLNKARRLGVRSGTVYNDAVNTALPEPQQNEARERQQAFQYWLNRLAIIATAIKNDALDEDMFKEVYFSTFMENSEYLKGYIESIRELAASTIKSKVVHSSTAYAEIEYLSERWRKAPLAREDGQIASRSGPPVLMGWKRGK